MEREKLNVLSKRTLAACLMVYREKGPGLLESIYELCLLNGFRRNQIEAESQISIPLMYRGYELSKDFRIDILVEQEIVLEVKAVE